MKTSDFDYILPEKLIAQTPLAKRDEARMLVLDKKDGFIEHKKFYDILSFLNEGDTLVLNNTKVMPARLYGKKLKTEAHIEILLLKDLGNKTWECMVKPGKRIKVGDSIVFSEELSAICTEIMPDGLRKLEFAYEGIFYEKIEKLGEMPIPPYIHQKLKDKNSYQTVYAKDLGSSAAPTAGLHFTNELLVKIKEKGIQVLYVTLHVGMGTFKPVDVLDITNHKMHTESFYVDENTANALNLAKESKKRIISVGTTTTRVLETLMTKYGTFKAVNETTDIFIYPGYKFKAVDALITNFHLPKSTLLMLVSALASKEIIFKAYNEAIANNYRFFSFGDCMFIK
jgi:S-adenosylmethionine:tRNA ribosyltransferase-isomerase